MSNRKRYLSALSLHYSLQYACNKNYFNKRIISSLRSKINAVFLLRLCLLIANVVLANIQKSNVWLSKDKTQTLTELVSYAIPLLKEMARPSPNNASRISESGRQTQPSDGVSTLFTQYFQQFIL